MRQEATRQYCITRSYQIYLHMRFVSTWAYRVRPGVQKKGKTVWPCPYDLLTIVIVLAAD